MIAVPSVGTYSLFSESFEGVIGGTFSKVPPNKTRVPKTHAPKNRILFQKSFAIHVKAAVTAGAVDGMMPGSARKTEHAFAMRAFAIDVGFAVSPSAFLEREKALDFAPEGTEGSVFRATLGKITGEDAEVGIDQQPESEKIQPPPAGKDLQQHRKKSGKDNDGSQLIRAVSAVHKLRHPIAERRFGTIA